MGLVTTGLVVLGESAGAGGLVGTEIGSLHLGHGSVCPSNCSWRTTILLEQWGQASRNGSKGSTEPEQWKNWMRQLTHNIPAVPLEAKVASLSDGNSLSLLTL